MFCHIHLILCWAVIDTLPIIVEGLTVEEELLLLPTWPAFGWNCQNVWNKKQTLNRYQIDLFQLWHDVCTADIAGINKGSTIFLHLLKELAEVGDTTRRVAFFHRNTSEARKQDILEDLQLPLGSAKKLLLCVVATVSLGKIYYFYHVIFHSFHYLKGLGLTSRLTMPSFLVCLKLQKIYSKKEAALWEEVFWRHKESKVMLSSSTREA